MPPVGFEPTISAGERPQTYALDRAATGTGTNTDIEIQNCIRANASNHREVLALLQEVESDCDGKVRHAIVR